MSDVIKKFYDNHPAFGINSLRRRKIHSLAALVVGDGGKRVLDVGCTTGYVSAPLKAGGNYVVGIDIADSAVAEAKKVLDEAYVVDAEKYPWPATVTAKKYDLIIVSEVLEHLFDQNTFMKEVGKVLAPGGAVLVTTPNFLVWSDRVKMVLGIYKITDMGHIRMLSHRTFLELCEKEGFVVVTEDHVYKPNWMERFRSFAPANAFAYQIVALIRRK